ncbi:MAG: peptide chain release factor N(5)-glutamine methyltransferase [Clostridia bacterium]|nr:peptide chain release factor N(5)-glutamine methyltransferase [Clostridia bacterium]
MTVRAAFDELCKKLEASGVESPGYEVRLMFEEFFGMTRFRMNEERDRQLSQKEKSCLSAAAERRCKGEPLQYILGKWDFMDRKYFVGHGVLIPRDDTEVCVRTCLDDLRKRTSPKVLELCAGTGIIAVTLAKQVPGCTVTAVEKEKAAFEYLEKNIAYHKADNVRAFSGDIFLCCNEFEDMSFDALVSNPPYIETNVVPTLQREVQFEPETALDGGSDGLDFYRCIARKWSKKLRSGGSITLEIGESQAKAVTDLLLENGFRDVVTVKDIQELDRVIYGTKA